MPARSVVDKVDKKALRELVNMAKGTRSIRQFANDSTVNPSVISRILNEDYSPGSNVLLRIVYAADCENKQDLCAKLLHAAGIDADYIDSILASFDSLMSTFDTAAAIGTSIGQTIRKLTPSVSTNDQNKSTSNRKDA